MQRLVFGTVLAGLAMLAAPLPADASQYYFRSKAVAFNPSATPTSPGGEAPAASLSLDDANLPEAKVGVDWSFDFAPLLKGLPASGPAAAWTFEGLPQWMLAHSGGSVSGRPLAGGETSIKAIAKSGSASVERTFSVVVGDGSLISASVGIGGLHACAVKASGKLVCWGYNSDNQVAEGATANRPTPTTAIQSAVTQVVGGSTHTCAIVAGAAKCWGDNTYGQLGNGTTQRSPVPVIAIASGVAQLAASPQHTCALTSSGAVACWGQNVFGQIGDGTNKIALAPVTVIASGATQVAVGREHSCALVSGSVRCWGYNGWSQVGDGTTSIRQSPVTVIASGASRLWLGGQGDSSCAMMTDGSLKCWGRNGNGQVGNGSTDTVSAPTTVIASGVSGVAMGSLHTCAMGSGKAWCWGYGGQGSLGTSDTADLVRPGKAAIESGVVSLSAGGGTTCARLSGGFTRCWGSGIQGQVGDGLSSHRTSPTPVKSD